MKGEILTLGTIEKLTNSEKKILRAERAKNLAELELNTFRKKCNKLEAENEYLKRREATLTAFEKSIPQRIETYKKRNAPLPVIQELQFINDMLMDEKEKILEYSEVEDER